MTTPNDDSCRRLGEAITRIATSQTAADLHLQAAREAADLLAASWGAVFLADGDASVARVAVYPPGSETSAGAELARAAMAETRTEAAITSAGTTFGVPLLLGERVLGLLAVQGNGWTEPGEERQHLLRLLATNLAVAIDNLRLRDRESELWQERNDFVSLVSHEFRTPLTSIKGYAQLARRRLGPQADPSVLRFLETIDLQADRLATLAADMVLYTRLGAGSVELQPSEVDLARVVARAVEIASRSAEQVRFVLDDSPPTLLLQADAERLERALVNVLGGAARRSPSRSAVEVGLRRETGRAVVWARDNGPTLTPEQRERVFERLYQRDNGPFAQGDALGLALAKAIAEAHGGTLWLGGEHTQGTTVFIGLPLGGDSP